MNPDELRAKSAAALEEADKLLKVATDEKRELSEEERKTFDTRMADQARLLADAKRAEDLEARKIGMKTPQDAPKRIDPSPTVTEPKESYEYRLGRHMQAVALAGGHRFETHGVEYTKELRATGANEGLGSEGGFLVDTEVVNQLLVRAHTTGVLRAKCTVMPVGANANGIKLPKVDETSRADGYRWGGVRVYRKAEGATMTESHPKWGEWKLDVEDMTGLCVLTDSLMEDAPSFGAYVDKAFGEEFGFRYDYEIYRGTGVGMMLGVLNSDATISVAKLDGQDAATILYENIQTMWSRMEGRLRPASFWVINQTCEPQLNAMVINVGTGGAPAYLPANGISQSPYGTLMGVPVIPLEQCAALGTVGDIALLNLSEYLVIEKGGMRQDQSIHVYFLNNETALRFRMRNNGAPYWSAPLTPYAGSTLSSMVTLATRA